MQLFRLRGLGPSRCTRQPHGTGPKHQERNLAHDSARHPNPRTPQTVKPIREQIFKRLTPAQHRLRHLRGHRLAKAPAAPVLLTRALPRGLAPRGFSVNICRFVYIFFFFFLTTSMWEESWEGYEQSRPPNPDLWEAHHCFGCHGPRSMTVVIVCTRSVVCPLE